MRKSDNQASLFVFNSWQGANNFQVFFSSVQFSHRTFSLFIRKIGNSWKYFQGTGGFTSEVEIDHQNFEQRASTAQDIGVDTHWDHLELDETTTCHI